MDPREMADFIMDERRDMSACRACGSPDPVSVWSDGCSDCHPAPFCPDCRRILDKPKSPSNTCRTCT